VNANLSKFEEFLQNRAVVLANRVGLLELSELVLVASVSTGVERSFGGIEFEFDEFVVNRRKGEDRFAVLVFRVFRSSKGEMAHDNFETFGSQSLVDLRRSFITPVRFDEIPDVLIPDRTVGEGFETNEFDEREDVVEIVLKGSSGKTDSSGSRKIASGFRLNRFVFFDDARRCQDRERSVSYSGERRGLVNTHCASSRTTRYH